jgi:nucleoside-diphosphate-sugar epimerase
MDNFKKIIVTGGAGYLGCRVVYDLAKRYPLSKITVIDNLSRGRIEAIGEVKSKFPNERIEIIPWEDADIRDYDKMAKIIQAIKPEIIVHLASIVDAFSTNRPGKDEECKAVNLTATVELAKIAKENGVKIFINQSSVSMYSRGEEIKEDGEKNPLSVYGVTKLKAEEEILNMESEDFCTCSLRSATLVGYTPSFTYQTIINLCCIRAVYDIPIKIFESALQGNKTYLDVADESRAIIFAIENIEKMNGQSYNVSSFHANLQEVINLLEKNLGKEVKKEIIKENKINQQVYTINSDKIKGLGFKPSGQLDSIIKATLVALLKRKEAYKWEV